VDLYLRNSLKKLSAAAAIAATIFGERSDGLEWNLSGKPTK
jgi:hypothetical protein